jgi:hypothetical protein
MRKLMIFITGLVSGLLVAGKLGVEEAKRREEAANEEWITLMGELLYEVATLRDELRSLEREQKSNRIGGFADHLGAKMSGIRMAMSLIQERLAWQLIQTGNFNDFDEVLVFVNKL